MALASALKNGAAFGALLTGIIGFTNTAEAIVIRGDKAPTGIGDYWDQANTLPAVANIMNSGSNYCTGTLINQRTILTAAHCFTDRANPSAPLIYNFPALGNTTISFTPDSSGPAIEISGAYAHVGYDGDSTDDVAIIALDAPVTNITPVALATADPSVGDVIFISGYGTSGRAGLDPVVRLGNGALAFTGHDDKRRIVYNHVDFVVNDDGEKIIIFDMDDPSNPAPLIPPGAPSGSNTPVHALEGSSSFGDSGGPMFFRLPDGSVVQVGVSQGGSDPNDVGDGNYTGISTYTRVAQYLTWIAANNPLRDVSASGAGNWDDASLWSEGVVPNEVESDTPGVARFFNVTLSQPGVVTLDTRRTVDKAVLSGGSLHVLPSGQLVTEVGLTVGAASMARIDGFTFGNHETLAGGTLGGIGTIGGDLTNGGVLSPGNSVGALTVSGDLKLSSGGQLLIEVEGTSSDTVTAFGNVTVDGGLTVSAPGLNTPDGTQMTFLTGSSVSGAFASVTTNSLFFESAVTIGAADASLRLTRKTTLAELGGGQGHSGVGTVLESLTGTLPAALSDALTGLAQATSVAQVNEYLRQLSGENHGLDPALGARGMEAVNALVAGRLAQIGGAVSGGASLVSLTENHVDRLGEMSQPNHQVNRSGNGLRTLMTSLATIETSPDNDAPLHADAARVRQGTMSGAWGEVFRTAGDVDASTTASGVGYRIDGHTFGYDRFVSTDLLLGASFGYSKTTTDIVTGLGDQGVTRATHGSAYGRYALEDAYVTGTLTLTRNETEARRYTNVGGITQVAQADYRGWSTSANVTYVRPFAWEGFDLFPAASLSYVRQSTDGYQETGTAALLRVDRRTSNALNAGLALRIARRFDLNELLTLTPEARVGGIYDLIDDDASVTARFVGAGTGFTSAGAETDRGGALIGAGAVLGIGDDVQVYADYDGYFAGNETAHTGLVGVRARF